MQGILSSKEFVKSHKGSDGLIHINDSLREKFKLEMYLIDN